MRSKVQPSKDRSNAHPVTVAAVVAVILLGVNVYRAATQSITIDEAFTYNEFVSWSPTQMLSRYDANHHILHSLLAQLSIAVLGLSEFTLRLPSLLGGLLYFAVLIRLLKTLLGGSWLFLSCFLFLALNPLTLDYLSAARGYGLGLALYLWALLRMVLYVKPVGGGDPRHLPAAGTLLGLSVAANLTFVFPAAGLIALTAGHALLAKPGPDLKSAMNRTIDRLLVPAILIAFVATVLPLTQASRDQFYYGGTSLAASLDSLVESLIMQPESDVPILSGLPFVVPRHPQLVQRAILAGLLLAGLAWLAATYTLFSARDAPGDAKLWFWLVGGNLLATLCLLIAARKWFGVLYPLNRTGLYLIPLFIVSLCLLAGWFERVRFVGPVCVTGLASLMILFSAHFLAEFRVGYYAEWRFDAGAKRVVQMIRKDPGANRGKMTRVWTEGRLDHSLEFYRRIYGLNSWQIVTGAEAPDTADYYVVPDGDEHPASRWNAEMLFKDPVSGVTLYRARTMPKTG